VINQLVCSYCAEVAFLPHPSITYLVQLQPVAEPVFGDGHRIHSRTVLPLVILTCTILSYFGEGFRILTVQYAKRKSILHVRQYHR
jgi:hypothetical protein